MKIAIEIVPGVLDLSGIPTNQSMADVISKVARDGQFAAVERRVADSGNP